ncbi:hypothetical protein [Vibrio harveyi]|uniref:hypothetical protein n=1 Tax=Vibrio harveyi TaxID=669 RepID=UPI002380ABF0|nr:hypothetical protein [Vibrio harveyi]
MNKLIALIIAVASLQLTGCATTPYNNDMPDQVYRANIMLTEGSKICMNAGYIEPKTVAEITGAVEYVKSTWTVDPFKWNHLANEFNNIEGIQSPSESDCNQIEMHGYELINNANNRKQTIERNNQYNQNQQLINSVNSINNSIKKPVFCNNIAGTVICN